MSKNEMLAQLTALRCQRNWIVSCGTWPMILQSPLILAIDKDIAKICRVLGIKDK